MVTASTKTVPTKAIRPHRAATVAAKAKVATVSVPTAPMVPAKAVPISPTSVKAPKELARTRAKAATAAAKVAQAARPGGEPNTNVEPQASRPAKPAKVKKPKLMRGAFTIPKTEYAVLQELKQRALRLTRIVKKSELIRAGIKVMAALPDAVFMDALLAVSAVPTRRSSKAKGKASRAL